MTKCCTRIFDYAIKIHRMFKMQPGKVNSKITLSCFPPDKKYLDSTGSHNIVFSLPLMIGKWEDSKAMKHTESVQVMVETCLVGCRYSFFIKDIQRNTGITRWYSGESNRLLSYLWEGLFWHTEMQRETVATIFLCQHKKSNYSKRE